MNRPLISVIIPLYNQEKYIGEAVASVLRQTYRNIELIVVDDGSTDSSAEIVRSVNDPRIRYFYRSNSGLPAIARNEGVKLARGEWIAFLDHDDVWLPNKLDMQLRALEREPKAKLVAGNMSYFDASSDKRMINYHQKSYNIFKDMLGGNRLPGSTVMVDKKVFDEMGGFREERDLKAIEDYDLWLRISRKYKIICLDRILARYRVYDNSTSGSRLKQLEVLENYLNKYLPLMISDNKEKLLLAKARSRLYLNMAFEYLAKDQMNFKHYLSLAQSEHPSVAVKALLRILGFMPKIAIENILWLGRKAKNAIRR